MAKKIIIQFHWENKKLSDKEGITTEYLRVGTVRVADYYLLFNKKGDPDKYAMSISLPGLKKEFAHWSFDPIDLIVNKRKAEQTIETWFHSALR